MSDKIVMTETEIGYAVSRYEPKWLATFANKADAEAFMRGIEEVKAIPVDKRDADVPQQEWLTADEIGACMDILSDIPIIGVSRADFDATYVAILKDVHPNAVSYLRSLGKIIFASPDFPVDNDPPAKHDCVFVDWEITFGDISVTDETVYEAIKTAAGQHRFGHKSLVRVSLEVVKAKLPGNVKGNLRHHLRHLEDANYMVIWHEEAAGKDVIMSIRLLAD